MRFSTATVVVLSLIALSAPISATQIRQINLEEMTARADRIVVAVCESVEADTQAGVGAVTRVTLRVDRVLKGEARPRITLKLFGDGSSPDGRVRIVGMPRFQEGEELLLFLYPESAAGFTSPVGFGQGKFVKQRDREGRAVLRNALGNRGLLEQLSEEGAHRLAPWITPGGREVEASLGLETLEDMVESLRGSRAEPARAGARVPR